MNGRAAYELIAAHLGWKRPDGTSIPTWNELSLSAQYKVNALIEVVMHYQKQRSHGD